MNGARVATPATQMTIAATGITVTFVTRDPSIAPEREHHSSITYRKALAGHDMRVLLEHELVSVHAQEGRRSAVLRHLLAGQERRENHAQVIVEQGTVPVNDLFDELRPFSANDWVTEIRSLIGPAPLRPRPAVGFELPRIGDAVSSRSVHAAMLDALRLGVQSEEVHSIDGGAPDAFHPQDGVARFCAIAAQPFDQQPGPLSLRGGKQAGAPR